MQEPENWEFIKWGFRDSAWVYIPNEEYSFILVSSRRDPFYSIILAAHGPVHEPTDAELAREAEIVNLQINYQNKRQLQNSLNQISATADNPSHWNRLSPEIKSDVITHYRKVLALREHEDFDGSGNIYKHIPTMPIHDTLEDMDGTPHSEVHLLLEEHTPLKCGDLITRKKTGDIIDEHTRSHYGETATVETVSYTHLTLPTICSV